jgi:type II secretory pathway pseudopilin PulG
MNPAYAVRPAKRNGFTIVELLVALALVMFIMSIISQVFVDASESFRSQRAKADLSEKLRYLTQTIRADLRANHFEENRRLSDPNFWIKGPPKVGYFRLEQASTYNSVDSLTQNDTALISNQFSNTVMAFTVFNSGQEQSNFLSTYFSNADFVNWKSQKLNPGDTRYEMDANCFNSPFAEIAYFLGPNNYKEIVLQDEPGQPVVRLYSLYRKAWLICPEELSTTELEISSTTSPKINQRASVIPNQLKTFLNTKGNQGIANTDVPMRRGLGQYLGSPEKVISWKAPLDLNRPFDQNIEPSIQDYLIAENVLSFTVEVLPKGGQRFIPLKNLVPNLDFVSGGVFDTWSSRSANQIVPLGISIDPPQPNFDAEWQNFLNHQNLGMPFSKYQSGIPHIPEFTAIRVTIRLFDTNNALSPSKTTWQATVIERL